MDFTEALMRSIKSDTKARKDPFLLFSRISDLVGGDFEAKRAADDFYRLDKRYEISKTILQAIPPRYKKRKKRYYKLKPITPPPMNAFVYLSEGSRLIHISKECPGLRDAGRVKRLSYARARLLDIIDQKSTDGKSGIPKPPICRKCGDFTPKTSIFF